MSAYSQGSLFAGLSTSSLEDSPVSPGVVQVKGLAQPTLATSGRNSLESFGKFSRVSSWAKMFAASLVGAAGFNSRLYVLTWKLKATKSSRFYFQLSASAPSISATDSGLWPAPLANDAKNYRPFKAGQRNSPNVATYAALLPPPVASDSQRSSLTYGGGNRTLLGALLPTPQASDAKRGKAEHFINDAGKLQRKNVTANGRPFSPQLTDVLGHSLNPRFVLEMMGFPADWCDLTEPTS